MSINEGPPSQRRGETPINEFLAQVARSKPYKGLPPPPRSDIFVQLGLRKPRNPLTKSQTARWKLLDSGEQHLG
ncbi:hypothetical protein HY025_02850 [Candidatus Daviesbacteria bacterium]|nr:hypothetical protein [Candidatus Daviesbacteria bacterium]